MGTDLGPYVMQEGSCAGTTVGEAAWHRAGLARSRSAAGPSDGRSVARRRINAQTVTDAGLGDEKARPGRVRFELSPQVADVHTQDVGFLLVGQPPHLAQELGVSQHLAGMCDEHAPKDNPGPES